jgi:hypothetical protein
MDDCDFFDLIDELIGKGFDWCEEYEETQVGRACVRKKLRQLENEIRRRRRDPSFDAKPFEDYVQLVDLIAIDQRRVMGAAL